MKTTLLSTVIIIFLVAGMGFGYFITSGAPAPAHFAIVFDRSLSRSGSSCYNIAGIAEKIIHSKNAGKGSRLHFFTTGNSKTAMEPKLVTDIEIPAQVRVMEGKGLIAEKQEAALKSIAGLCGGLHRTRRSPLLLAVSRAIEQLRSQGCGPERICSLYVSSDGVETEEKWFVKAIKSGLAVKDKRQTTIDAENIDIHFCGLASVSGGGKGSGRSLKDTTHLVSLWRSVFKDPHSLVFAPVCPSYNSTEETK